MWKDYFSFSKSEQKGMLFLLIIIFLLILTRWYIKNHYTPDYENISSFENEIIAFEESLHDINPKTQKANNHPPLQSIYDSIQLFNFNPNTCTEIEFMKLGLTEKQAATIINFRNKGGRFYRADDLKKIYTIPAWQSDILCQHITIPEPSISQSPTDEHLSEVSFFDFDPNTVTKEEMSNLGFSNRVATNIHTYRKKGGHFKIKSDLLKIYGFDTSLYVKITGFINLPDSIPIAEPMLDTLIVAKEKIRIGLNSADTAQLKKLAGIGDVFATRIVKYREKLGGFHSKKQLLEVYGMQTSRYKKFEDQVFVDSPVYQIEINFASQKDLQAHPYLNYDQARTIIKHRNKNGPFGSIEEILTEGLLDENSYEKLAPYITVEINQE